MLKELGYQTGRIIGSPLFKNYYSLTINNKENIPKKGSIILCGNHLHVFDQFPVICATNRTTHWMAKKEYFDSKLGFLFKGTGSICVDRQNNPKESEKEAIAYLKNGSAIGLFPEGTRNGLKKEMIAELYTQLYAQSNLEMSIEEFTKKLSTDVLQSQIKYITNLYNEQKIGIDEYKQAILNSKEYLLSLKNNNKISIEEYEDTLLLPFKFGAVSMAKKTDSYIIPFGVTGKYEKNSDDLTVSFGTPFKVEDDLEKANNKLREDVLTLIKSNKNK